MNETKIRELLQAMKVAELRKESHERGLTLESKGKKFTKAELIERIVQYDMEHSSEKEVEGEEKEMQQNTDKKHMTLEDLKDLKIDETNQEEETQTEKQPEKKKGRTYAKTLEEIVEKYSKEKPAFVYDEILKVDSFVVFVQTVEAKNGNFYDKLRKAKVVGVNRKKRIVKVETAMGMELIVPFEALLCIAENEKAKIPTDVNDYLFNQRRENREYKQKHGTGNYKTKWMNKAEEKVQEPVTEGAADDDEEW